MKESDSKIDREDRRNRVGRSRRSYFIALRGEAAVIL